MEGQLEGLARAAANEGAHLEAALDLRLQVRRPTDRRLRVNEGRLLRAVQKHRRTVGGHCHHALPLNHEVEQPAGEQPGIAQHLDVVAQVCVEGQQGRRVHRDRVALQLE